MHIKFNSLLYLRCVILVLFLCKGDNLDGVSLGSQSCVSMFLYSRHGEFDIIYVDED